MLPFTREQFFQVFATYNSAHWAAAMAAYPLALAALLLAWRGGSRAARWVGLIFALMWGWVGFVYQGIYFSQINPVARAFAAAFLVQAVLFVLHAAFAREPDFHPRSRLRTVTGAALISYAMVAYPVIGLLAGEHYPAMPLFGVTPCPLLIFTFGLFVWAKNAPWWLWIVPLFWSVIGGSAAILLTVPQDWALPVSAVAAASVVLFDRGAAVTGARSLT